MKALQVLLKVVVLPLLPLLSLGIQAQALRDPTQPPPEMGSGPMVAANAGPLGSDGMAVIVRGGKPFLVVGSRLYAPGQRVGPARIERITETEVWLREGKALHKVPRFAGIQRSAVSSTPDCGPGVRKTSRTAKAAKATSKAISGKAAKVGTRVFPAAKASTPSSNAPPIVPCGGVQP